MSMVVVAFFVVVVVAFFVGVVVVAFFVGVVVVAFFVGVVVVAFFVGVVVVDAATSMTFAPSFAAFSKASLSPLSKPSPFVITKSALTIEAT